MSAEQKSTFITSELNHSLCLNVDPLPDLGLNVETADKIVPFLFVGGSRLLEWQPWMQRLQNIASGITLPDQVHRKKKASRNSDVDNDGANQTRWTSESSYSHVLWFCTTVVSIGIWRIPTWLFYSVGVLARLP
jgi:hypothetical protein